MFKAFKIITVITFCALVLSLMMLGFEWVQSIGDSMGNDPEVNVLLVFFMDMPILIAGVLLIIAAIYSTYLRYRVVDSSRHMKRVWDHYDRYHKTNKV